MAYMVTEIENELKALANDEKRLVLQSFFKMGVGEYGEGDLFLGIPTQTVRKIAYGHLNTEIEVLDALLASPYNEVRLCALCIIIENEKSIKKRTWLKIYGEAEAESIRKSYFDFYLSHTKRVNNWNLVDLSCPIIVGEYLLGKSHDILYKLADSTWLWNQRIAIVSTLTFIKHGELTDTFSLAEKFMYHPHPLIHKSVGWMLREAGKRDVSQLKFFLNRHATVMPRIMLNYAIEKFCDADRLYYLTLK